MSRSFVRRRVWVIAPLIAATIAACGADPQESPTATDTRDGTAAVSGLPPSASTTLADPTAVSTPASTEAPASSAPTVPTTAVDPVDELAACVRSWPLTERIALLVWPAVYSNQWSAAEEVVREQKVGGVVLMKPTDGFAADLAGNLDRLDAASAHGVAVAVDEEGGQVQRLAALGVLPSQQAMSAMGPAAAGATIAPHAQVLADAGIDVILGPVVDVRPVNGDDPLGQGRLFVGGPDDVAALGAAYVAAWQSAGLLPVLKHYPGHGSASADTHDRLATTPELSALVERDLVPYQVMVGSGAGVMVGHLDVPGLTNGEPASLSPSAVSYLRNELGWGDALVMTDALGMGAVGLSVPDAAVRSLQAGIDVVIFTSTDDAAPVIAAIERAVAAGVLSEAEIDDSATRVARLLEQRGSPCNV
jgi:beta-N-acetylhexosaminidase